jgi:hypothetical protein
MTLDQKRRVTKFLLRYRHIRIADIEQAKKRQRWVEIGAIREELDDLNELVDEI